jgi:Lantibiotic modifying enzyme
MANSWLKAATIEGSSSESVTAAFDVSSEDVQLAFAPARLVRDAILPGWVESVIDLVGASPDHVERGQTTDMTAAASLAMRLAATRLLDWESLRSRYRFLTESVLDSLTSQLATRVILASGAVLEMENLGRAEPVWNFSRDAWIERLCGFTSLNFTIGTAVRQWRQSAVEILGRLARDLPQITEALLRPGASPRLKGLELDLGDRHNDGRSVAVAVFADGQRVVYKPKDLRSSRAFLALISLLNGAIPGDPLPTRRILCRDTYAWEEYVDQWTADGEHEAAVYFRRYGRYLRLLQLVEARDFWIDNLRVSGSAPVFVDLECILHGRLPAGDDPRPTLLNLDPELYEESVLPTAAVTMPIPIPGSSSQDFGGLSAPGVRVLPLGMWPGYHDQENGNFWLREGRLYWLPLVAWPTAHGAHAEPRDYLGSLEAGYMEAQRALVPLAPAILSESGPLEGIGELPVRVLIRSTWDYLALLRDSLSPTALLNGNARELALTATIRTASVGGLRVGKRLAIARCEIAALRLLDIPEFFNRPATGSAVDSSGALIPDVFEGSALERLRQRLTAVDQFDATAHVRILRAGVLATESAVADR